MLEQDLAEYIESETGIPCIVGLRPSTAQAGINLFQTTSLTSNIADTDLCNIQISVRHQDLGYAKDWVERIKPLLRGFYGTVGESKVVMWLASVGGEIQEEDGDMIHIPIFVDVKI